LVFCVTKRKFKKMTFLRQAQQDGRRGQGGQCAQHRAVLGFKPGPETARTPRRPFQTTVARELTVKPAPVRISHVSPTF